MFERFDDQARQVFQTAGEFAAERTRERTGEDMPRHVRVQVQDVRRALDLIVNGGPIPHSTNWQGGFNAALSKRIGRLRELTTGDTAVISVHDVREVMR